MTKNWVNLSTEEIQSYCLRFKLSSQELGPYTNDKTRYYYDEKRKLSLKKDLEGNQAYSEEQINKLIFRVYSKNTVLAVIRLHDQLISENLSPTSIYKIAAHSGGSKNLETFLQITQDLRNQGLTWHNFDIQIGDVIRILSREGGSKNLQAFINITKNLRSQGLTWHTFDLHINDVVRILAHIGGSKNLDAYITATQNLRDKGLTWEMLGITISDVVRILAHNGGAKNLEAFISATQNLKNQGLTWPMLGLSMNDTVCILSRDEGAKNLEAFIAVAQHLVSQGLTWQTSDINIDDVMLVLSHRRGHIRLQKMFQHISSVSNLGFSMRDIVKVVILPAKHLSIMVKFINALLNKFNPNEREAISKNRQFKKNIHAILSTESNHRFTLTKEEIAILNNIFSLNNDPVPLVAGNSQSISEIFVEEETIAYAPSLRALLELFDDELSPHLEFPDGNNALSLNQCMQKNINFENDIEANNFFFENDEELQAIIEKLSEDENEEALSNPVSLVPMISNNNTPIISMEKDDEDDQLLLELFELFDEESDEKNALSLNQQENNHNELNIPIVEAFESNNGSPALAGEEIEDENETTLPNSIPLIKNSIFNKRSQEEPLSHTQKRQKNSPKM